MSESGILAQYYHWCQGVFSLLSCQSTKSANAKTMKTIFYLIRSIDIHFSPTEWEPTKGKCECIKSENYNNEFRLIIIGVNK